MHREDFAAVVINPCETNNEKPFIDDIRRQRAQQERLKSFRKSIVRSLRRSAPDIDKSNWIGGVVLPMMEYHEFLIKELPNRGRHGQQLLNIFLACYFELANHRGYSLITEADAIEFLKIAAFEHARLAVSC